MAYDAQLASSGITTAFDSLAVGYVFDSGQRPRDPRSLAEAIRQAQAHGILRAEHFLHIRCEVGTAQLLEDFAPFADDPMVRLVSLMDHRLASGSSSVSTSIASTTRASTASRIRRWTP